MGCPGGPARPPDFGRAQMECAECGKLLDKRVFLAPTVDARVPSPIMCQEDWGGGGSHWR